jgi:protein-L-isoaspartate(D-aspartate) O-methyltransferase
MPVEPERPWRRPDGGSQANGPAPPGGDLAALEDATSRAEREQMVRRQIEARGVRDPAILAAMRRVPRHLFVPADLRAEAYADHPLPIGLGQTISQPYIVGLMTELARPDPTARVLEVGTGSGYQAAVLSCVAGRIFSLEIHDELARQARERLARIGCDNVTVLQGDGHAGLATETPFDIVIVTAAPPQLPPALVDQLGPGGRLVAPVGPRFAQQLCLLEKQPDGSVQTTSVLAVVFVPMVIGTDD